MEFKIIKFAKTPVLKKRYTILAKQKNQKITEKNCYRKEAFVKESTIPKFKKQLQYFIIEQHVVFFKITTTQLQVKYFIAVKRIKKPWQLLISDKVSHKGSLRINIKILHLSYFLIIFEYAFIEKIKTQKPLANSLFRIWLSASAEK